MLQPYQQRVVTEQKEVFEKLEKLGAFIRGDVFGSLSLAEQGMLNRQYEILHKYLAVLDERIDCFENV